MTRTRLCTAAWLLLTPWLAGGASLGDLYTVTVPVYGRSETARTEAFGLAMRDALARATGRRDAADLETLAPLVRNAASHVVSYRGVSGNQLAVTFDGRSIEEAIDRAGLPFWEGERPLTLVWLAVERGASRQVANSAVLSEERQLAERAAEQRGLPLAWPAAGDGLDRAAEAIWSGQHASLLEAARRYGAEGVLIGRATAVAGGYRVDWTFSGAGATATTSGDVGIGLHLAADRYAARYASPSAGQRSELRLTVTGIDTLESYAAASHALQRLAPVRSVAVAEVTPDSVTYLLAVRGDAEALRRAIRSDGRLAPVGAGALVYVLSP